MAACVYNEIQIHISLFVESTTLSRSSSRPESAILTGVGFVAGIGVGADKMLPAYSDVGTCGDATMMIREKRTLHERI